jgi:hypothetical protein
MHFTDKLSCSSYFLRLCHIIIIIIITSVAKALGSKYAFKWKMDSDVRDGFMS